MTHIRINLTKAASSPIPQLYMHKEDKDTGIFSSTSGVRSCASPPEGGCPAVFVLKEPRAKTQLTKDWQFYIRAINYAMSLENVFLLLDNHLAFANNTGFESLSNPGKKDYFFGRTEFVELPRFDKDRTCSRNLLSGVVVGDKLRVTVMDGNQPPPMKEGKPRPQRIEDVRFEDYLYNPRDHRWMFVVANRVTTKPGGQTSVAPFPRGAVYPWTGDGQNYSFLPLVSREEILYPLKYLKKLIPGEPIPNPYRIVTTFDAVMNLLLRTK